MDLPPRHIKSWPKFNEVQYRTVQNNAVQVQYNTWTDSTGPPARLAGPPGGTDVRPRRKKSGGGAGAGEGEAGGE